MDGVKRYSTIMLGLLLIGLGLSMAIKSNLGVAPWEVLHIGLTKYVELSLGQINIIVGLIVILISMFMGQYPGTATVLNILVIGMSIDFYLGSGLIPTVNLFWQELLMLLLGIYAMGWGTSIYLSKGRGCGPREGLVFGFVDKFGKPVWMMKAVIEISVLIVGAFLGGPVGIGTVLMAVLVGFVMQHAFGIMKVNGKEITHERLKVFGGNKASEMEQVVEQV